MTERPCAGPPVACTDNDASQDLSQLAREPWDVVVVGAGPAGATAATHVARAGHRVLLIDKHAFPRDKVCGDGLIADTLGALDRLGALPAVLRDARHVTATSVYSAGRHRIDLAGQFLTLKRQRLDALIVEQARTAGVALTRGLAAALTPRNNGIDVTFRSGDVVRAAYTLIATGADDTLLRRATASQPALPSALALRCYVRSSARIDRLVISYDRAIVPGYAWIFPLRDDEYNVGCGVFFRDGRRGNVNLRSMFDTFVQSFPEARNLMEHSTAVTPLKGAPLRCGLGVDVPPDIPRVLAIGETIGTTYPFTGEGIGKAMEAGELAARTVTEALQAGDPQRLLGFTSLVQRVLAPKYRAYRTAERWLARPWVTDLLARRARHSEFLRAALSGILNESIDPRTVFSVSGIARSLFS